MAKEVQINLLCDFCLHDHDKRTKGETLTIAIGFAEPREIDVCKPHRDNTPFHKMVDALAKWGRPVDPDQPNPTKFCPIEDCDRSVANWTVHHKGEPFVGLSGVRRHLTRTHSMEPEDARARTEELAA